MGNERYSEQAGSVNILNPISTTATPGKLQEKLQDTHITLVSVLELLELVSVLELPPGLTWLQGNGDFNPSIR